jgi:hypothetical protein
LILHFGDSFHKQKGFPHLFNECAYNELNTYHGGKTMAKCPKCQSSNVVVTEEVYTRKGRTFYRFVQTILVILIIMIAYGFNELFLGILLAIAASIVISVFSLINASKRAISKTKLSCLDCKAKTYL